VLRRRRAKPGAGLTSEARRAERADKLISFIHGEGLAGFA
jgi:hypothetical protein